MKKAPLVLLHGFTGTPDTFGPLIAALRQAGFDAPIVAPPLPGHIGGRPLDAGLSFADALHAFGADLERHLDAPGAATPAGGEAQGAAVGIDLLGYSLGGRLALSLLLAGRLAVRRAVLVGVNPGLADPSARSARRAADATWATRLRRDGLEAFLAAWEQQPLFASQQSLPPARRAAQDAARRRHDPEQLARALETFGLAAMPDHGPALAALAVPTLFVAGALDTRFAALAAAAARAVPTGLGSCAKVPGAGHNVVLEQPEALARLVHRHLAG